MLERDFNLIFRNIELEEPFLWTIEGAVAAFSLVQFIHQTGIKGGDMHPCVSGMEGEGIAFVINEFEWPHLIGAVFPFTCKGIPLDWVHISIAE